MSKDSRHIAVSYVFFSLFLFIGLSVIIGVKVFNTIRYEREELISKGMKNTMRKMDIEAIRGNIYACDGSLLATSVPVYEVRMDTRTPSLTDEVFYQGVHALAVQLSNLFRDKNADEWEKQLIQARKKGNRYFLIKRNVSYQQLQELKKFSLFQMGRYKGGMIVIQKSKRHKPFQLLASRVIGYEEKKAKPVGLEGAYSKWLRGQDGKRMMRRLSGGVWMPVEDENEIEPFNGSDIYTTLDVNIQDVAEDALLTQLQQHNADHGCVILMEVKTGEIKAMANLKRNADGSYSESYNYAIGESTEPGSTFKTASLMALLEDGLADTSDIVDTYGGTYRYYDREMKDSHKGGYGKISLKRCLEVSSNVGVSKIIYDRYAKNPERFVNRLYQMGLGQPLGIEIAGEAKPRIKRPTDKDWYGTTLPWMSIGYEVQMTPLQILTFYNAIANQGVMVKPKFVTKITYNGRIIEEKATEILNPSICSRETLEKIKKMLEGVVENGTARNLKNSVFKIAGKTGTAQIANRKHGYKTDAGVSYQASFVGYFPAENPKYSCIVVINAPSNEVYYGNLVAGPIFKEVADKVYATDVEMMPSLNQSKQAVPDPMKYYYAKSVDYEELFEVAKQLRLPVQVISKKSQDFSNITYEMLIGMNLSDAVYLLESKGWQVIPVGGGNVRQIDTIQTGTIKKIVLQAAL